jgi:hypothetical protein
MRRRDRQMAAGSRLLEARPLRLPFRISRLTSLVSHLTRKAAGRQGVGHPSRTFLPLVRGEVPLLAKEGIGEISARGICGGGQTSWTFIEHAMGFKSSLHFQNPPHSPLCKGGSGPAASRCPMTTVIPPPSTGGRRQAAGEHAEKRQADGSGQQTAGSTPLTSPVSHFTSHVSRFTSHEEGGRETGSGASVSYLSPLGKGSKRDLWRGTNIVDIYRSCHGLKSSLHFQNPPHSPLCKGGSGPAASHRLEAEEKQAEEVQAKGCNRQ